MRMPLYEYVCRECDHAFEALVSGNDQVECPECHGRRLERQLSLPGLPQVKSGALPSACGDPSLPPCGAPGCRRTGQA
jgi:putative FmdB family regulatory protein